MKTFITACCLVGSASVFAQQAPIATDGVGADTRSWLELQKTPAAQASDSRPVPGEVAERVYQRYVNSFSYPIPQQFPRESFSSGRGGSSGGSK